MITNPRAGWCTFKLTGLDDFVGSPSYLTDVPCDLLQTFINYRKTGSAVCSFDEEGTGFVLVIESCNREYIISETDMTRTYEAYTNVDDLQDELIHDIESDIDGWAKQFEVSDFPEDIAEHKAEILSLLSELKEVSRQADKISDKEGDEETYEK